MPLIKSVGAANLQSPVIARKFLPLCYRNTRLGCVLTNAINKRTICKKIDFNLLRLFYSLVWFADFPSFKRLTFKRGLWGIFGVTISTPEFFSAMSFTSVLLDTKLIWSLDCNYEFFRNQYENSRAQNSHKRLSCVATMTFLNLFYYSIFFKEKEHPLFVHCIPQEAGVPQR